MATALVFNPGSNSLKFELIRCEDRQQFASQATKLASATLDDIGKQPKLTASRGDQTTSESAAGADTIANAVGVAMQWLRKQQEPAQALEHLDFIGVRVVHGGSKYAHAVRVSDEVRSHIEAMEDLAPLHNQSSIDVLDAMSRELPGVPCLVAFDTAFHRTLPEHAWRYPIERETADRLGIRKFGFHGISHRYMLEHYARTIGKPTESISLVTLHLESGSSACAIFNGQSVDNTMGLTPLEGLMMGSRSGSIDPAIVPFLERKLHKSGDEILKLLNKQSGLLGIAVGSLDTRELKKRDDEAARLALAMFAYRVRMAVGAYLAVVGDAEAVLLGGGIGEDSPWLREAVCAGLQGWGLELDDEANRSTQGMRKITKDTSRLQAWAMPTDEGLQIAHECLQTFLKTS